MDVTVTRDQVDYFRFPQSREIVAILLVIVGIEEVSLNYHPPFVISKPRISYIVSLKRLKLKLVRRFMNAICVPQSSGMGA